MIIYELIALDALIFVSIIGLILFKLNSPKKNSIRREIGRLEKKTAETKMRLDSLLSEYRTSGTEA